MRQHDAAAAQPAPAFGRAHHSKKDLVAASAAPVACNLIPHSDLYNLYGQKLDILEDWIRAACSMCGHAWVQARLAEEAEHNDEEEADAEARLADEKEIAALGSYWGPDLERAHTRRG